MRRRMRNQKRVPSGSGDTFLLEDSGQGLAEESGECQGVEVGISGHGQVGGRVDKWERAYGHRRGRITRKPVPAPAA